jgi:hypothetical protein
LWFGARPEPQNGGSGGLAGWKYEPPGRTLPLAGLSVSREHRFLIVIGEWIVEPWFDDRLEGFWRVPSGIDPHAGGAFFDQ